ncbi:MAG: hypothetical protein LBM69_07480 [Lachnospiraceae bacterium]|jgi:hypothetical protein|nr:hypothetical protein [Lachnospiraceae bacterium]
MQSLYTTLKVNNEIELCEVAGVECKIAIEKALLNKRISYYIRWLRPSVFLRRKNVCIICINDNVREEAEAAVRAVCDETGYSVRFLMKRSRVDYL